jgi:hypothetical protein
MRIIQTYVDVIAKEIIHASQSSDDKDQQKYLSKKIINFVICGSCYWCASFLKLDTSVLVCPSCNSDNRSELSFINP